MSNYRTDWFVPSTNGQPMEGRFVYLALAKKRDKDFQNKPIAPADQYYEATIIFPKSATDSLQAPYLGPKSLVEKVWQAWTMDPKNGGQWKPGARWPVLDCDVINPNSQERETFAAKNEWARNCWRIVPWSMFPPRVVDQANLDVPKDMYGEFVAFKSGDYGYVSINCFAYVTGSGGVNFEIEGVKKTRDGDAVGGAQRSPEQMFSSVPPQQALPLPQYTSFVTPELPQAPQRAFRTQGEPAQAPQQAPQWGAPPAPGYATQSPSSPGQGAPVWGGAPTQAPYPQQQPGYPPAPQGMPPQPPVPFGSR